MIVLFIYQILFLSSNIKYAYWEDYTKQEQEKILEKLPNNTELKAVYFGDFILTDDDRTEDFMKSLCVSYNRNDRMLKFYLLNKIMESSDGALSEMVSTYCLLFFKKNSCYVLRYFGRNVKIKEEYAFSIAAALYHNEINLYELRKYIKKRIPQSDTLLLDNFLCDVEKALSFIKDS